MSLSVFYYCICRCIRRCESTQIYDRCVVSTERARRSLEYKISNRASPLTFQI